MKQKTIAGLSLTTVVCIAAAMYALRDDAPDVTAADQVGETLFPALGDASAINRVARIEVEKGGEVVSVVRRDGEWGVESLGGFPARFEAVKQNVLALADLERLAAKTDNPELYDRLGVQEPDTEESTSTRVTLADEGGATLASLIVGKPNPGKDPPQLYVRAAGEDRAWLVEGSLSPPAEALGWVDKTIANIQAKRVQSITVAHADGEELTVYKSSEDDLNYSVAGVPEGRELLSESAADHMASGLSYLNLEDVVPQDEIDFEANRVATAVFQGFDGLRLTATVAEVDEESWLRFEAAYEAPPEAPGPAAPEPEPAEGEESEADADDAAPPLGDTDEKSPADVKQEAEDLNAVFSRWAYKIPSYKLSTFTKRVEELTREIETEDVFGDLGAGSEVIEETDDGTPVVPADGPRLDDAATGGADAEDAPQ